MIFGPVPVAKADGAILAHSLTLSKRKIRKGRCLDAQDLNDMAEAGVDEVIVARLEPDDMHEDAAAAQVARALAPDPAAAHLRLTDPATGRVNLYATAPGVVQIDAEAIRALNKIDPMITFACPQPFAQTREGALIGTVKIISYAVSERAVNQACAAARSAIRVRPTQLRHADLILTTLDKTNPEPRPPEAGLEEKGRKAIAVRLEALGMTLGQTRVVPHETDAIAAALRVSDADLVLILTASATSDAHDVAPEGLRRAGGRVTRFGMPVDPGNLLFLGDLDDRPVIGLPGCARSPALNGADFVLARVAAGIPVSDDDIAAMGIGGLLKEIPARGRLRES